MYKGKQPAPKNTTTKSYNSESAVGKKSTTVSKDRTAPKFSSFNNIIQTNQSVDMNNSRRVSNNQSPGNSMILSGVAGNGSNSKVNRKQFTNSYAVQFQDKINKSKNSKDDSLNISKRLPTNTSMNNYNSNKTLPEEHNHVKSAHSASKANPNENNSNLMYNKSSQNVNSNFAKPPIQTSINNINNNNSNNKLPNINLDLNDNKNENMQQLQNSRRESVEYKNTMQNNFTFNNNMPSSNVKENSTTINQNTNGNVLTGPGNTNNNNNNYGSNQDSSNTNSNIYINSKNSKEKADGSGREGDKAPTASQMQNVYKNNSSSKIVNANLANNKADQIKKFAADVAKSKGKNNIYDLIKNTTGKKPTANSTDSKGNISKKNSNNTNNNSINSLNNNNNNNNKLLGSTEIKRIPNDKENSLLGFNLNNSQNLENLNQKNSKILNSSNQIKVASSNNFSSSPVKPIKNDQNPFINLNGSIGFSSIDLLKSPKNDEEENKLEETSADKITGAFNKYRNDNKQKNALSKKNSVEIASSEVNNLNDIIIIKENAPQEDDFNFNYKDEKIYSENQENSKKEIVEDDLGYFDKAKENTKSDINSDDNDVNTNTTNKYNHIRGKSNNYLTNEPLTSIEELDEKHNLLNTEENVKSNKETNSNAGGNINQKEENKGHLNKIALLSKNNLNNNSTNFNSNANKGEEFDKKKTSLQSLNSLTNFSNSPARKTYKNETDDQEIKKTSSINVGFNAAGSESKNNNEENEKQKTQRGFNYKEDFNKNKDSNSFQNMTNNISPINNDADQALKKKNSTETDLNLTPIIQIKDQSDVYKKGRISRKSNDLADLMMLNNLIDEKLDIAKASEPQIAEKEKASPTKQSISANNLTKTTSPKKQEAIANLGSKALAKSNLLRESAEKKQNSTNNIKEKTSNITSSGNKQNKTLNKLVTINPNTSQTNNSNTNQILKNKETINNTSTIKQAKENQNSILINKDENSFLNDLAGAAENSKILNTNVSVKNLKTGGNELNSSKTFNKLLSPREGAAAAIAAGKSFSKQKTLGSGKKPFESKKSIVAVPGRPSIRKSLSINPNNQSAFKNNLNRTGLGNTTMNSSTLDVKKKTNFISKSKLQFNKPNQSDFQSTKLSRKSILGKIMSTRNINSDDRSKNILTDIDKESFDVSVTQANQQKRPINHFNSLSRMSLSSFGDSYDFNFDRKFSGTLRSDDWMTLKRRNTKSFPDKFFKGNFYKKNSMIISPENQINLQNKSFNSISGSGPCENIKIRINEYHVINRTKLKPKTKNFAKYNKGKYELIESFDASFGVKRNYHANELCVSPSAFISLNEKDEAKEILIKPPNLRKEQKDEINQKLFEKLQGNFIDESITKITKMNRLERMRNNRYSSISVSPTRIMNHFCFSPLVSGGGNGNKDANGLGSTQNFRLGAHKESDHSNISPGIFSDRTLKYSSMNDESINLNNNNNNNDNQVVKAQKKIGNSKVLLMDNNFMICSGDEEKVFSPFDSYIEGNNFNIHNNLISPGVNNNLPGGAGHKEITNQNKLKLEKLERLEKISNTALNISRTNLKHDKSNLNTINENNNNDFEVVMESAGGFTIAHFDNIKNPNNKVDENLNSPNRRMKRIKALEPQNVINLLYQMHPEKNKFGFYSFANKEEDFTSNAFSLLKSSALNNNKNPNQMNKSLNNSLHISNPVSESINVTRVSNLANNRNNHQKLEINNNNFELEKNQNVSNTTKNINKNSNANLKKITFDLSVNQNDIDNNDNNNVNPLSELGSEENSKLNSNAKSNVTDEGYSLTFAGNNNQNNLNHNLRDTFKSANNKLNSVAEAISNSNNTNPAAQKALLETKNTLAENIRKHKENFNDTDFFDKVKNFMEAKRIQTKAVEQAYLNSESSVNKSLKNRANLSKLDAINRSAEKANNSILNVNKSIISNANVNNNNNNNKTHSYNPNYLVVVSSGNRNFPFGSNNIQSSLINENNNTNNNILNSNSNNTEVTKAPENRTKSLKDALHRLNDLDSLDNQVDSSRLVLPMNTRTKAPLRESTEANEKNSLNEANIELLSEKLKKEKQMELLNQRYQEKLVAMKNSKNNSILNNTNSMIDNFHDFEFENFKNEFKRNNMHNGFSSQERALNENLNTLTNINSSKLFEPGNKKDEILISDEQLSEFKDKFLGKSEFIDKENVKLFYKKYLKGLNNNNNLNNKRENNNNNNFNNANKFKNFFSVDKVEKSAQLSDAVKKEKELTLRLEKLKNMLKIDDPKKAKELKNLNSQNFLYEKAERKNEAEVILNNLNSSYLTNILNLNESKINNANYNSAASNNNTLKLLGGLSSLKFGSNFGNSLGNTSNNAFGNSNNANNNRDSEEKLLPINQLNFGIGVNSSKNALARDLKFNF